MANNNRNPSFVSALSTDDLEPGGSFVIYRTIGDASLVTISDDWSPDERGTVVTGTVTRLNPLLVIFGGKEAAFNDSIVEIDLIEAGICPDENGEWKEGVVSVSPENMEALTVHLRSKIDPSDPAHVPQMLQIGMLRFLNDPIGVLDELDEMDLFDEEEEEE